MDLRRYRPGVLAEHPDVLDRVSGGYDDPGRAYHNLLHLAEVFERIDVLLDSEPAPGIDRDAVLLAAWFHDAVYDTEGDNEERSAELAERELATAEVPPLLIEEVARLVRLTATHQTTGDDRAGTVLCDADLGILAAERERYEEYVAGVREEYAHVSDDDFRSGRAQVLRQLMGSPTLFSTSFARQHWEGRARANVEQELSELDAGARRPGGRP